MMYGGFKTIIEAGSFDDGVRRHGEH